MRKFTKQKIEKIREIASWNVNNNLSNRGIARLLNISESAVRKYRLKSNR